MRVMQLHIEELMRQSEQREKELQKTQAQLKEHAKQRAVQQPQERKLFARLEQLQAELKTARELRSKAEAHSVDLQQQLEQVVMAAESESDKPDQQQLVRVTTQQLDATNTLLQQVQLQLVEADRRAQLAQAEAEGAAEREQRAQQVSDELQRRLTLILRKNAQAAMLTLAPPSKGQVNPNPNPDH